MNAQQKVFETQLYFYFLFRLSKIWSITHQSTKETQIIQFQFLLALEHLHANQAPDLHPSVRVNSEDKYC